MIMAVKIFNVLENAAWSHHNPVMPGQTQRLQSAVTPAGRRYCEPRLKTSYLNPTWYLMYLMNMLNWSPSQPLSFPCYPNDLIFIMLIVIIMTIQMMTPSSLMMMMMIIVKNPTHFFILNNSTHTPLPLSSSIVSICLTPASPYYPFWYFTPFLLDPGILGPIYGSEPP